MKYWIITLLAVIVIGYTNCWYTTLVARHVAASSNLTLEKLNEIQKQIELTANSGQFEVGAYWAYRAIEVSVKQQQPTDINNIILKAKVLHSAAIIQSMASKPTPQLDPEKKVETEIKTKQRWWWPFTTTVNTNNVEETSDRK